MPSVADLCRYCCSGWMIRKKDSQHDKWIKRGQGPSALILLFWAPFLFYYDKTGGDDNTVFSIAMVLVFLGSIIFFGGVLVNRGMGPTMDLYMMTLSAAILSLDWYFSSEARPRAWSMVVLMLDTALVFDRPRPLPVVLLVTILWLIVEAFESAARVGIYKAASSTFPPVCDCVDPPCASSVVTTVGNLSIALLVLLLDFHLTRGFATELRLQLRRVNASVEVAAKIAGSLASYDIENAGKAINNRGEDLPEELVKSYLLLLSNLKSYRAYLPEALLPGEFSLSSSDDSRRPPSTAPPLEQEGMGDVAMVFTDIQSSTALWETYPKAMYQALRMHNSTLRELAKEFRGYEVKIMGDALMLAFAEPDNAVGFGTEAQMRLVQANWPANLCNHPTCQQVDGPEVPLWHGPRVRIGANWGQVQMELNPVTQRYDFFGGTVNCAARVEVAIKHGGLTGITQALLDQVYIDDIFIAPLGKMALKGITEPVEIYVVLPRPLAARWDQLANLSMSVSAIAGPAAQGVQHLSPPGVTQDFVRPVTAEVTSPSVPIQKAGSVYSAWGSYPDSCISSDSEAPSVFSRLDLGLMTSIATCATVRTAFPDVDVGETESAMTEHLACLETTVLRTEGQLLTVVSATCVLCWNAGLKCAQHIAQSARFVTLMHEGDVTCTGAASGIVLFGNVSSARRRHVTVAGTCVELSAALADAAVLQGTQFMTAGHVGAYLGRDFAARKLAIWTLSDGSEKVEVWGPDDAEEARTVRSYASSFPAWGDALALRDPGEWAQSPDRHEGRARMLSLPVL
eukprot:Hpha_TRINITY_DN16962_c2_g2::TRINITY_DN16962_c2_g2_i1::g.54152::m.54152